MNELCTPTVKFLPSQHTVDFRNRRSGIILLLDILVIQKQNNIQTTVYRKSDGKAHISTGCHLRQTDGNEDY